MLNRKIQAETTKTVENIHCRCLDKLATIRTTLRELAEMGLPLQLEDIEMQYTMEVAGVLSEYFESSRADAAAKYLKLATGFVVRIDEQIEEIKRYIIANVRNSRWITKTITALESRPITIGLCVTDYEECCGAKMTILSDTSEMRCDVCGAIKVIYGMVFKDDQFYTQDGQKTKHGDYRAARHLTFWIDRIQAKEKKEFKQEEIDTIRTMWQRDKISPQRLTCDIMREYLSKCGMPHHNDHAALLMKILTGIEPPQLDIHEERDIILKFNAIVEMHDKISTSSSTSRAYYPYYLYKIIEQKYEIGNEKRRLLKYIHMQSDNTVIKKDTVFKTIMAAIGDEIGMKYKPTNYIDHR